MIPSAQRSLESFGQEFSRLIALFEKTLPPCNNPGYDEAIAESVVREAERLLNAGWLKRERYSLFEQLSWSYASALPLPLAG